MLWYQPIQKNNWGYIRYSELVLCLLNREYSSSKVTGKDSDEAKRNGLYCSNGSKAILRSYPRKSKDCDHFAELETAWEELTTKHAMLL